MPNATIDETLKDGTPLLHVAVGFRSKLTKFFDGKVSALLTKLTNGSFLSGSFTGFRSMVDDVTKMKPREAPQVKEPTVVIEREIESLFVMFENLITVNSTVEESSAGIAASLKYRGRVLQEKVSTTTLLQLKKDLGKMKISVEKLSVLNRDTSWAWDAQKGFWVGPMKESLVKEVASRQEVLNKPPEGQPYPDRWVGTVGQVTETTYPGYNQAQNYNGALHQLQYDALVKCIDDLIEGADNALADCNSQKGPKSNLGGLVMAEIGEVFNKVTDLSYKQQISAKLVSNLT